MRHVPKITLIMSHNNLKKYLGTLLWPRSKFRSRHNLGSTFSTRRKWVPTIWSLNLFAAEFHSQTRPGPTYFAPGASPIRSARASFCVAMSLTKSKWSSSKIETNQASAGWLVEVRQLLNLRLVYRTLSVKRTTQQQLASYSISYQVGLNQRLKLGYIKKALNDNFTAENLPTSNGFET